MRHSVLLLTTGLALLCAACAHYRTPGGAVQWDALHGTDADAIPRQPSPHFPSNLSVVRLQASEYQSATVGSYGKGRYSLVTSGELLSETQLQAIAQWPAVASVGRLDLQLLPRKLESLDDLRLSAAKLQSDILLMYTVETTFRIGGQDYGPDRKLRLGGAPGEGDAVTSVARAVFTDVRTGYTYGEARGIVSRGLDAAAVADARSVDAARLAAERDAFTQLVGEAKARWGEIARHYR